MECYGIQDRSGNGEDSDWKRDQEGVEDELANEEKEPFRPCKHTHIHSCEGRATSEC